MASILSYLLILYSAILAFDLCTATIPEYHDILTEYIKNDPDLALIYDYPTRDMPFDHHIAQKIYKQYRNKSNNLDIQHDTDTSSNIPYTPLATDNTSLYPLPMGFIPLQQIPNTQHFGMTLEVGTSNFPVDDLLLDTTGQYTLILTPSACSHMIPPLTDCVSPGTPLNIKPPQLSYYIDTYIYRCEQCNIASDRLAIQWSRGFFFPVSRYVTGSVDFVSVQLMQREGSDPVPQLSRVGQFRGVIGLAKPSTITRPLDGVYSTPFADIISALVNNTTINGSSQEQYTSYTYGLDLRLPNNSTSSQLTNTPSTIESRMWLNGIPDQYRTIMRWSTNVFSSQLSTMPIFRAYDMTLCNVPLYQQVTILIDTTTPCLVVPTALYDAMLSWMPLQCNYSINPTTSRQCYFHSDDVDDPLLPTLNFKMDDNPNSPSLFLSMDQLLLPMSQAAQTNNTNAQPLCIVGNADVGYIRLGTVPLSAFYFHYDMASQIVGLANKVTTTKRTENCLPRLECIGQQSSYPSFNFCYPPVCDGFIFWSLDETTQECKLHGGLIAILAIILVSVLAAELALWILERKTSRTIKRSAPRMQLLDRSARRRQRQAAADAAAAAAAGQTSPTTDTPSTPNPAPPSSPAPPSPPATTAPPQNDTDGHTDGEFPLSGMSDF